MIYVAQALLNLKPGAKWTLDGDSYEGIKWIDTEQTIPTEEEVLAEIENVKALEVSLEYREKREREYPDFKDYLDGIVKGDQAQIQAYIDACLAVKAKYPKPQQ